MSKKVISILLSAAMLVAMFCVGFGAVSASADGEATYYFLAPDNYFKTEAGAANTDVGYYYWAPAENAKWPGEKMTPAPEVHPNAFKVTMPDSDTVAAMVFNAFVDAGTPQDPELAKVAHQTSDVYLDLDDYNNMIFVLDLNNMTENPLSGALSAGGDFFPLDSFTESDNYKTYGFTEAEPTPELTSDSDTTPVTPAPTTAAYKEGDAITVEYKVNDVEGLGAISSVIAYDHDALELDTEAFTDKKGNKTWYSKDADGLTVALNNTENGIEIGVNTTDPEFGTDVEAHSLLTFVFKAKKALDSLDGAISVDTSTFKLISGGATVDALDQAASTVTIAASAPENPEPTTDTDTAVDTDTAKAAATDSDKASDTDTAAVGTDTAVDGTDTATAPATDSDKASDSAKDSDSSDKGTDSAKSTDTSKSSSSSPSSVAPGKTGTTTTTTTPTVATAGTFAVISLVVILMAAAGVVIYTRKKTEE